MATDTTAVPLGEGFEPHVRDWETAAAAVLRKARKLDAEAPDSQVWDALASTSLDGITISALGTPHETADLPEPGMPGQAPFTRGRTAGPAVWDIRARFADPDPARTREHIAGDLAGGVNSLWLTLGPGAIEQGDVPALLEPVYLDLAPVILDAPHDPVLAANTFVQVLRDRGITPASGTNLGADPLGARVREYGTDDMTVGTDVAKLASDIGVRAIVVDGTAVHDAGASDVQELAYTMAAGVTYMRMLNAAGYDVNTAAALLEFRYAVTNEQFTTIAKLRAARRLWHRVCELSGVRENARGQVQHAVTSRPMMTRYDPTVNMLRTTVAALSAGVGGASSITVFPFDDALGLPEPFSRRIARNTGALLMAESHIAAVTDPAGGSHTTEKLTDDLARAAWTEFGQIEEAGGIEAVIADGTLADRIGDVAQKRDEQIATRTRPLTGVSEYPNSSEGSTQRRPAAGAPVRRYAEPFEELRDTPASRPVFLATMGSLADYTARVGYALNVFTAGGVTTREAGPTDSVEDVVTQWNKQRNESGTTVACLCGPDDAYRQWGAQLIEALREAGATRVLIAGRTQLDADDAVYMGADVLAFLHRTRHELETHA